MKDEIFSDEAEDEDIKERKKREFLSVVNKKSDEYDPNMLDIVMVPEIMEELKRLED